MSSKGAIVKANTHSDQYISDIFLGPRKNGGLRPIISLRSLNQYLHTEHFKVDHLIMIFILPLIKQNSYLTSLDLRDAYFTIPVKVTHRKYLRFLWKRTLYEFVCMCFGLSPALRIFTKVMPQERVLFVSCILMILCTHTRILTF